MSRRGNYFLRYLSVRSICLGAD